ncbi:hypothetical protein ON064_15460 [Planococcus sp. A6]|nr:hypothetical protein [Planococcus sp. A6]MDE0584424.1 hypothetical protein [Planococcus sp. A6]
MQLMRQDVALSAARGHGLSRFLFVNESGLNAAAPTSAVQMRRK